MIVLSEFIDSMKGKKQYIFCYDRDEQKEIISAIRNSSANNNEVWKYYLPDYFHTCFWWIENCVYRSSEFYFGIEGWERIDFENICIQEILPQPAEEFERMLFSN